MTKKKGIAILGSTGSVGKQALEVIEKHPDHFYVSVLTANQNHELLIEQALKHKPNAVVIADESKYQEINEHLFYQDIKVFAGEDALEQIIELDEIDIVLNAILGFSGLKCTIKAIETDKILALANKESLVVAGNILNDVYSKSKASIVPVDSEHSAIFQCVVGEFNNPIEKIILTASGGPFLDKSPDELENVSIEDALNHPTWNMGNKISIDSATLINKGFEVISAKWLYNLRIDQIDILIHPESIIHSFVEFEDGSLKAQLAAPDMRLPIQYAFSFPERLKNDFKKIDLFQLNQLSFREPDFNRYPNLLLTYRVMDKGGSLPCVLNAGNEIAVEAFLKNKIKFVDIYKINEKCLEKAEFIQEPTLDDYIEIDKKTREFAKTLIR